MNKNDIELFNKAVESLRQYRRYEILDENNKNLLDDIYVDPIEGNALLRLCLKDNTTVLVGRKGTGKSTIFMKMQNELRKSKDIMTCYIDVKTIFDTAKRNYSTINYLKANSSKEIENYSIQRQFILDFVSELISEISKNYKTRIDQFKDRLHIPSKVNDSIKNLKELEIGFRTMHTWETSNYKLCKRLTCRFLWKIKQKILLVVMYRDVYRYMSQALSLMFLKRIR